MARGRGKYPYKFTANRKTALRKAQLASARKRKGRGRKATTAVAAIGITAAVGGAAVYGIKARNGRAGNPNSARNAVNPSNKEAVRKAGAISPPMIRDSEKAKLRAMALEARHNLEIPANGLGRNGGGPGRTHAGKIKWGDPSSVDPNATKSLAEKFGHTSPGDPEQVLRSTGMIEKSLPKRLLKGERIGKKQIVGAKTIRRAVSQRNKAVGHLIGRKRFSDTAAIDAMIVQGEVFGKTQKDLLNAKNEAERRRLMAQARTKKGKKKGKK